MSNYTTAQAQDDVRAMIAQVKTLTVEKLKNLLRVEVLPLSGVKSELQIRLIARMFNNPPYCFPFPVPLPPPHPDIHIYRYRETAQCWGYFWFKSGWGLG